MQIKVVLKEVNSFIELEPIVKKSQVKLSFWGSRYISVQGYKGSLPEDALAEKVLKLVRKNPHFDEIERRHGKAVMRPIDNIYRLSDQLVKESRSVTKLFITLRKLGNLFFIFIPSLISSGFREGRNCSKIRWYWRECDIDSENTSIVDDGGYYKVFQFYTETQYRNLYHAIPHPADVSLYGLSNLYLKPPRGDVYTPNDWFD